jgi:hypothetical protein
MFKVSICAKWLRPFSQMAVFMFRDSSFDRCGFNAGIPEFNGLKRRGRLKPAERALHHPELAILCCHADTLRSNSLTGREPDHFPVAGSLSWCDQVATITRKRKSQGFYFFSVP